MMNGAVGKIKPNAAAPGREKTGAVDRPGKKRRRWRQTLLVLSFALIVLGAGVRALLPSVVRWYVNRTLDRNILYDGRIGDITINLWRGEYSISDIRLLKITGNVPVPFFQANRLDLAIDWNGILHRKIVGTVSMEQPQINFVDASDESASQTGAGGPWLQTLEDLFPFELNSLRIHDGSIHFRSYKRDTPVDVYLGGLEAGVDDLTNVRDATTPLVTSVWADGLAMDQAKFEYRMKLDPFSYRPTFHLAARLIGLDVTTINDFALTYGSFDFKRGWFDLVIDVDASEGQMQGYVKPLFRGLKVFDAVADLQSDDNPLQFFWQALVGGVTLVLKNQPRDQFGTYIPLSGDVAQPNADILSTVGNVLRNGFVRAYLPKLDNEANGVEGLQFGPPSLTGPDSIGDE